MEKKYLILYYKVTNDFSEKNLLTIIDMIIQFCAHLFTFKDMYLHITETILSQSFNNFKHV